MTSEAALSSPATLKRWWIWVLPLVTMVLVCASAIGVVDYYSGYGEQRVSMAQWLMWRWGSPDWQHGVLVLPIIIGLIVWERKKLAALPVGSHWFGLVMIGVSCLFYYLGYRVNNLYLGHAAVQGLIGGVILFCLGPALFKALFFHWLFIAFAWPLVFLEENLALKLRLVMCEISTSFLNLIHVPTLREGSTLVSAPDAAAGLAKGARFSLNIEGPCSGLRSLFALTMMGALFGYVSLQKNWQRALVFLSAFPLAIAGNFVRLMILLVGTLTLGTEVAIGVNGADGQERPSAYHLMAGVAVFLVAFLGMMLLSSLLKKGWRGLRGSRRVTRTMLVKPQTTPAHPETAREVNA